MAMTTVEAAKSIAGESKPGLFARLFGRRG